MFEYLKFHHIWFSQNELHKIYKIYWNKISYIKWIEDEIFEKLELSDYRIWQIRQISEKTNIDLIEDYINNNWVNIICINSCDYPDLLKNISNPPFIIYVKWEIESKSYNIAIVWSRKFTSYWENICKNITADLSFWWFNIVSWWAYWIDTIAHETALNCSNKTIAVIWTWIDIIYPNINKRLYEKIVDRWWTILSIFRLNTMPDKFNFPIRNEIIAWISKWVVVIEAWKNSWTLITARLALEQWKDVFVVPWDINKSSSIWSNILIRDSIWKLITWSEDILSEYSSYKFNKDVKYIEFENDTEKKIYEILIENPKNIDWICEILDNSVENISIALTMMEMNSLIIRDSNWKYNII